MNSGRKYLTKKEKASLFLKQEGRCACGCGKKLLPGQYIAEHEIPNFFVPGKPDALWHKDCADEKTNGTKATTKGSDKHEIARTKRLSPDHPEPTQYDRRKARGGSSIQGRNEWPKGRKLESRGFQK